VSSAPPEFLRLAAHPVRWQLLGELARSDRRGQELTERVGERQSLVAYHLGQLRRAGVVDAHRSLADGRDVYYRLDLARCRELLAGAAASLHPALAGGSTPAPVAAPPVRVLFLCTGNSARSQIAEALLRARAGDRVVVASAGSEPRPVSPRLLEVLRARGVDARDPRPEHVDAVSDGTFDLVVTLCDRVREACPDVEPSAEHIHWSVPPPDHDDPGALDALVDDLETRIAFLLAVLGRA
jgi:protein-tyrosine-phosphatase/DNA-binding transcriptional ArsR family regulator